MFDRSLAGSNLQVWDSDQQTSCDFRGVLRSIDGSGSLSIDSNYVNSSTLVGTKFKFVANSSCPYVKVRAY
jgi:hypothetical protein